MAPALTVPPEIVPRLFPDLHLAIADRPAGGHGQNRVHVHGRPTVIAKATSAGATMSVMTTRTDTPVVMDRDTTTDTMTETLPVDPEVTMITIAKKATAVVFATLMTMTVARTSDNAPEVALGPHTVKSESLSSTRMTQGGMELGVRIR